MAHYDLQAEEMKRMARVLRAGDSVKLSGVIYTARDAAHKRLLSSIERGEPLPFEVDGATIYYAGPTPARPDAVIGACGPTTSSRMDVYAPLLLKMGLACMIGKGERGAGVDEAMRAYGGVYLAAVGGAGALIARCIERVEVLAYDELGCESIKRLHIKDFPAVVAMDCVGGNLFRDGRERYALHEEAGL